MTREEMAPLRRKIEDMMRKDDRSCEIIIRFLRGIGVKLEVKEMKV